MYVVILKNRWLDSAKKYSLFMPVLILRLMEPYYEMQRLKSKLDDEWAKAAHFLW